MAHRLDSFKYRFSKLLGMQFEILMCVQYEPEYGTYKGKDGQISCTDYSLESEEDNMETFPVLGNLWCICMPGSNEIFKVFLITKYSKRYDQIIECIVGVLDKAALLKNLHQLIGKDRKEWIGIIKRVELEARRGNWHNLDFSSKPFLMLNRYTVCQPLKWEVRKRPSWRSATLRDLLRRWKIGNRKVGKWRRFENGQMRGIYSPIFD